MNIPKRIEPLVEDGLVDTVFRQIIILKTAGAGR
jgi:hypothetical protein